MLLFKRDGEPEIYGAHGNLFDMFMTIYNNWKNVVSGAIYDHREEWKKTRQETYDVLNQLYNSAKNLKREDVEHSPPSACQSDA